MEAMLLTSSSRLILMEWVTRKRGLEWVGFKGIGGIYVPKYDGRGIYAPKEPFELSCIMPSLQTALPPELANNAIRLYRECLRRVKYVGSKQYNTQLLVGMVRQQFKKHMHETDPDKIQKLKDDAARGLINHMLHESEKMTGRKFSQGS
ncbi:hypothetical protein KY284_008780 [Solanum tuberosum]|nr:hypothetical protein KY284_008780 [Solanum tuberosum]